jgi:hypothetical protein
MMNKTLINPFDVNYFIGYVNFVSPVLTRIHFPSSTLLKKFQFAGEELNSSLVGYYVAIEGENYGFLGKIVEVSLPEKERLELNEKSFQKSELHPVGKVEILFAFNFRNHEIKKGLDQFPSVGAKVFICSSIVVSSFFKNFGTKNLTEDTSINFATLSMDTNTELNISAQALFGRHCAIVGSTGGGKSFTVAKLIEEIILNKGKAILIDATGEYDQFSLDLENVTSVNFRSNTFFHYSRLKLSDIFILFRPSEQVQLPKLQEAIKSLKLVGILRAKQNLTTDETIVKGYITEHGLLEKAGHSRTKFLSALRTNPEAESLEGGFNIQMLPYQIYHECIWNTAQSSSDGAALHNFGGFNERDFGMCQSLLTRMLFVSKTPHFDSIFGLSKPETDETEFVSILKKFIASNKKLLRISLSEVPYESSLREILVNAIGCQLLEFARDKKFISPLGKPLIVLIDEAHQFLNKRIKGEFAFDVELNAFDEIAKECRKYGLFLVLSTQMPRDIPAGTLSQVGAFIVHRLINQQDKEAVENACSASNQYSLAFIPVLGEGEAILMGVDFPMPVAIKIKMPLHKPKYGTPPLFT